MSGLAATAALLVPALSGGRRREARPVSGTAAAFATDLRVVYLPHTPPDHPDVAPLAHLTAGIALQSSPTKETLAALDLDEMDARMRRALRLVEGEAAMGWAVGEWPGLADDLALLSGREPAPVLPGGDELVRRARDRVASGAELDVPGIFGLLPGPRPLSQSPPPWISRVRARSRLPWSRRETRARMRDAVPIGGTGGEQAPRTGPPETSEPPEEESSRDDRRLGLLYPEWDLHRRTYRREWVAVLEQKPPPAAGLPPAPAPEVLRWFTQAPDRAWHDRLEDGTDLDVGAYIDQYCRLATGEQTDGRIYATLARGRRDVATALLLDASSSLQVRGGSAFELELACADALVAAMSTTGERFAVFAFTGESRHRVEVRVLRDFDDPPGRLPRGRVLRPSGYTRLGAPLRHVTRRLLAVPAGRRVLLSLGDGLPSDEAYEGRYAEADVARAVLEAEEAGILTFHIGVGRVRHDPLPVCFGRHRSERIASLSGLPGVLARVHEELIHQ